MTAVTRRRVRAGEIEFEVLEAGEGPLALCLHGFPDTPHTWRHLLPRLAAAGYHAVAPYLRGYAPTSVPADGTYQLGALVADANNLHRALRGDGSAVLVGHDWGASTAYTAAAFAPELWQRLVMLSVPPPAVARPLMGGYDQMKRSWYMTVAASPYAEMVFSGGDLAFVERLWRDWSPGHDPTEDLVAVRAALTEPGSLAAALAYYRDALAPPADDPYAAEQSAGMKLAPQPTLYLHGADDGCVGSDLAAAAETYLTSPGSALHVLPGVGHFPQLEQPGPVNDLILSHLER